MMTDTQLEEHTHLSYALSQLMEQSNHIEQQSSMLEIDPQDDIIKVDQQFDSIDSIRQAAIRYARRRKFAVSTLRSGARQLVLVCKHSGKYRETKSKSAEKSPSTEEGAPLYNKVEEGATTTIENGSEIPSEPLQKKHTRKKISQKIQCPFQIRAKPLGGRWIIYKIVDEHNHDMAADIRAYAQHRKLSEETKKMIIDLMLIGTTNAKIMEHLQMQGIDNVLKKDIANLRQAHFGNKSLAAKQQQQQQQQQEQQQQTLTPALTPTSVSAAENFIPAN
ncbi:MAG: hypothetical protein EXX96DRAFT_567359 [Benjaminiella poitrasii]|nr:MAG: hypothetical protein EXX96DRAFT_567359 [Benjaminiella poitrasii]